jgi:hypothetical protein
MFWLCERCFKTGRNKCEILFIISIPVIIKLLTLIDINEQNWTEKTNIYLESWLTWNLFRMIEIREQLTLLVLILNNLWDKYNFSFLIVEENTTCGENLQSIVKYTKLAL